MTLTTLIFLCFFTTISGQYYYQYSACRDLVVNCQTLRAYRWCSSYVNYMRKNCGRTCGFCRPVVKPSCIDRHRFCLSWKNKGECRRNPGYMKQYCQRSCGFCQTPKDGKWSSWGVWSKCSVSCGGGRQVRYRQCNKPAPANGGKKCAGSPKQTRSCNNDKCAIATDGKWSTWSNWSKCSKSCGGGRQYRSRQCDNPAPVNGGIPCSGRNRETRSCNDNKCAAVVDGNWSSWRPWSKCSATCGGGTQVRYRQCDSPPPQNGGMDCPGSNKDSRICNTNKCATAVDGQWGPWSQTSCSVTCGTGTNTRLRRCDSPPPSNGGKDCIGASTERKPCTKGVCPIVIDGNWGTWGVWSECSRSCNGGIKSRYRNCDNPSPTMGGQYCRGQDKEQLACNTQRCKAKARLPPFICGKSLSSRIVGGSLTKPSDWPWQAGLKRGNEKTIFCGGSIINREWVVTAAHCIYRMEPSRTGCVAPQPRLRVVLGEFDVKNVEGHEVTVDVAQVCMHPRYDHRTLDYDIALLRLSDPIMAFTQHVKPVCLPPSDYVLPIGQNCTVTGFGRVGENDKLATKLRQATVPLKHLSYCKTQYPLKVVSHRMICAGYEDGQIDSCKGDSGGPFVCKDTYNYVLAGAVSWGVGCARPGQPGLYTNIPYFLPWLRTTMKQN